MAGFVLTMGIHMKRLILTLVREGKSYAGCCGWGVSLVNLIQFGLG